MGHSEQHMQENPTQKKRIFLFTAMKENSVSDLQKKMVREKKNFCRVFFFATLIFHFEIYLCERWYVCTMYICCGIANVPFQLRCERQTKWKNGAPSLDVQQKIYKNGCVCM